MVKCLVMVQYRFVLLWFWLSLCVVRCIICWLVVRLVSMLVSLNCNFVVMVEVFDYLFEID